MPLVDILLDADTKSHRARLVRAIYHNPTGALVQLFDEMVYRLTKDSADPFSERKEMYAAFANILEASIRDQKGSNG